MVVVLCGDVCNVQRAVQQTSDGRVEREQAFAELEAAKKFADAHHGCCLTCEERCSANIDNVQEH